MKIETQLTENHQAKLNVEIEAELLEEAKVRAARKIARRIKIPGFRPGKAPLAVITRQVGDATILEEALDLLIDDLYPKIIQEAGIDPYGPGSLENVVSTEPLVMEFTVPLAAEVDLGDYRSLRLPFEPKTVTDDDISSVLENLRERQAVIEPVERPAQMGDLVALRLSAKDASENGSEPENYLIQPRSTSILITQDDDQEWPFPGFSNNLVGVSANDAQTVSFQYGEDEQDEFFKGKEVEFYFTVESVKSRSLPELDDDFAASVGDYDNMEALKKDILATLERQAEQAYSDSYDNDIIEMAVAQATFKYPPQMLEQEVSDVISDLERRLEQQNLDMELYLKTRSLDMDGLREELHPIAESRLKRSLFLFELARKESIELNPQELARETEMTMNYLSRSLPEKEARKLNNEKTYRNITTNVMADMLLQRSRERLRAIGVGDLDKIQEEDTPEALSEPEAVPATPPETPDETPGAEEA